MPNSKCPRRLVVPRSCIHAGRARIDGALHHYLCHVLRLRPGSPIELIDGTGCRHHGTIEQLSGQEVSISIRETHPPKERPTPRLVLVYGLSRRVRTEWVLQKATELGVDWIVPGVCERSVARPRDPERKLARWQEILAHATRQCGRAVVPLISPPLPIQSALAQGTEGDLRILASSTGRSLSELQHRFKPAGQRLGEVVVAVGPEGGFSGSELTLAGRLGYEPARFGPLTLRTETAAVAALALVAFLSGRHDP